MWSMRVPWGQQLGPSGGAGVGFADRQQIVLGMEGTPGTRLSSQRTWHIPECVRQCIKEGAGLLHGTTLAELGGLP